MDLALFAVAVRTLDVEAALWNPGVEARAGLVMLQGDALVGMIEVIASIVAVLVAAGAVVVGGSVVSREIAAVAVAADIVAAAVVAGGDQRESCHGWRMRCTVCCDHVVSDAVAVVGLEPEPELEVKVG